MAVPYPIQGMTTFDQPAIDFLPVRAKADADQPVISIVIDHVAVDWSRGRKELIQSACCGLAAPISAAIAVRAFLPAFRRIYAVKPYAFLSDLDGVPVDYGGTPRYRVCT